MINLSLITCQQANQWKTLFAILNKYLTNEPVINSQPLRCKKVWYYFYRIPVKTFIIISECVGDRDWCTLHQTHLWIVLIIQCPHSLICVYVCVWIFFICWPSRWVRCLMADSDSFRLSSASRFVWTTREHSYLRNVYFLSVRWSRPRLPLVSERG